MLNEVKLAGILGEYICKHVFWCSVCGAYDAVLNLLEECVNSVINVLGSIIVDSVFAHPLSPTCVFEQGSGSILLETCFFEHSLQKENIV